MLKDYRKDTHKQTEVEKRIFNLRVSDDLSLWEIDKKLLIKQFDELLVRASAITGVSLQKQPLFFDLFKDELITYLLDFGYESLTLAEILYAFKLNTMVYVKYASGMEVPKVDLFGEFISVDYVSRLLYTYKILRDTLDSKVRNSIEGYATF